MEGQIMQRKTNWHLDLEAAILAAATTTYTPKEFSCSLFAADCILAMTGEDVMASFRDIDAPELVAQLCADYEANVRAQAEGYGMEEVAPGLAQRGDLVGWDSPQGFTVGIVAMDGRSFHVPDQLEGMLRRFPLRLAKTAWRV